MATRKVLVIEEIEKEKKICHRQTEVYYEQNEDGKWNWIVPKDRLDADGLKEWNRIMDLLKDVHGEDLRHIVCGVGLLTHCLDNKNINCYSN